MNHRNYQTIPQKKKKKLLKVELHIVLFEDMKGSFKVTHMVSNFEALGEHVIYVYFHGFFYQHAKHSVYKMLVCFLSF